MPSVKLYDSWTWGRSLPEPFNTLSAAEKKRTDVYSIHNNMASNKKSTLHASTLSAVFAYMNIAEKGAVGKRGNLIIAEYPSHRNETHVCVYDQDTGKFTAGVFQDASSSPEAYVMKSKGEGQSGSALFFPLVAAAYQDPEFQREYLNLMRCKNDGYGNMEKAVQSAAILCDNLYRRIENAANLGSDGIKIDITSTGNIPLLNPLKIERGEYAPTEAISGKFEILKPALVRTFKKISVENFDFEGKYTLSERSFTDEERRLIPKLEDWYVIPSEVVTACKHAKMTTGSALPMRTFMFRGVSGTGKTEGARAVAAGLGLPYLFTTCSANTEELDLLGQFTPDVSQIKESIGTYPTLEDIHMDPSTAYCTLTGIYKAEITEDEVYNKLVETIRRDAENQTGGGQRLKYVDTPLVNAIRYGWVCELQEPSIIANPGVLVKLNGLLDRGKSVTLPTGEVVDCHPDTVIIVTTNNDYVRPDRV